jgi:Pyridoxamine 5'-phosphate oxidase
VLEAAELFWISTVRADGRPHVTPLVAAWLDGAIHFHTGADEQKAANLRANPHVVLTTGCNRWNEGLDVVVEGEAVRVSFTRPSWACPRRTGSLRAVVMKADLRALERLPEPTAFQEAKAHEIRDLLSATGLMATGPTRVDHCPGPRH